MPKKETVLRNVIILSAYLLVVWGLYRFLFQLPEEIEEIFIKPIVWLLPVAYLVRKEKANLESVGITIKNLFPSIYLSLLLGAIFAIEGVALNFVKYGGFNFGANIGEKVILVSLGISFATAISEEITFRGYIFNRVWGALGKEWTANIITSLIWALVHVPITVFVLNLNFSAAAVFLFLTTIFGVGSAFLFARTRNVFSSIFLHVLWQWPIILFR